MRRTSPWSISTLAALAVLGTASAAQAQLTVTPQLAFTSVDGGSGLNPGEAKLVGSWDLECSVEDADTTYGFGELKVVFTGTVGGDEVTPSISEGDLTSWGGTVHQDPAMVIRGDFAGSKVTPRFSGAFCHHDTQNSALVDFDGPAVLVAPLISTLIVFDADDLNTSYCVPPACDSGPVNVPVGRRLVPSLAIYAHPYGSESLKLHMEGAGVSVIKDLANPEAYVAMDNIVSPSSEGDLKVWVELVPYGAISNALVLHASGSGSGSSGSSGGSSTGSSGGDGGGKSGCGSVGDPGLSLAGLLALAALRRRVKRG